MSWKRIVLAFLVLALAGGYYYFDTLRAREEEKAREAGLKVLDFSGAEVVSFSIERPGKETITIRRTDGKWKIVEPVKAAADEAAVTSAISAARNLEKSGEVGKADDLKNFGLEEPVRVGFELSDGKKPALEIGSENPAGLKRYATLPGSGAVILVSQSSVDDLLKNLYEFREKKLFNVSAGSVNKVVISRGGMKITVVKDGKKEKERWKITEPVEADADERKVQDLIAKVVSARASGFVDEEGKDLDKYGLNPPEAEIELVYGNEKTSSLLIGGVTTGGGRLAKTGDAPVVVRVPAEVMESVPEKAEDLRDKRLVVFTHHDVKSFSVETTEGKKISVENRAAGDDSPSEEWWITEPGRAMADGVAVSRFLYDLEGAEAAGFVSAEEAGGLVEPGLKITLKTGEGERVVRLGKKTTNSESRYFAAVDGRPDVMEIDEKTYDTLISAPAKFRDTRFFKVRSDEVGRIVIDRLGQLFEARRSGDGYILASHGNRKLKGAQWNTLLWTVLDIKYEQVLEKDAVDYQTAGFDRPALRVSVYNNGGELVNEIVVGSRVKGGKSFFARSAMDSENVYKIGGNAVTERMIDALEKLLAD